jgi:2,3-bisphosphoglycerate-independent phosphoglycerate mutase
MHTGRPVLEIEVLDSSRNYGDAQKTAKALNHYLRWTHEVLSKHPINDQRVLEGKLPLNMTVTKWPGRYQKLMSFYQKTGLSSSLIASAPMYKGMANLLQMNYIEVDEGEPSCEMINKLAAAKHAFDNGCDFVHLHTKAADEAAHSHSPLVKAQVIEAIDFGLSDIWSWEKLQEDFLIAITADHCTPSHGPMLHSGESVPLSIMGEGIRVDSVNHFSERLSVGGSLGQLCSRDIMPILLNASNRSHFLGGRPNSYESLGITSFKAL